MPIRIEITASAIIRQIDNEAIASEAATICRGQAMGSAGTRKPATVTDRIMVQILRSANESPPRFGNVSQHSLATLRRGESENG